MDIDIYVSSCNKSSGTFEFFFRFLKIRFRLVALYSVAMQLHLNISLTEISKQVLYLVFGGGGGGGGRVVGWCDGAG